MNNKKAIRNLAYNNLDSGNEQIKSLKKIIQKCVYPRNPERFSTGGLGRAVRLFNAYRMSNDSEQGLADLMLFFVECGSQFTLDYGDMDEDFYVLLEEVFEDLLLLIKNSKTLTIEEYQRRLFILQDEVKGMGWRYSDGINELLDIHFPNFLKNEIQHEHTI